MNNSFSHLFIAMALVLTIVVGFMTYKKNTDLIATSKVVIPLNVLFGASEKKVGPCISPDGKMIAYRAPVDGVMNIWLRSVAGSDDRPITHDTGRGIQTMMWAYDNDHMLYVQDMNGDENWQLYKVNISDGAVTNLTPIKDVTVRIIAYEKEYPERMLLAINERDPKDHDVYELNIQSGKLALVEQNPGSVVDWIADNDLQLRAMLKALPDGSSQLFVRDTITSPWRLIGSWTLEDDMPGVNGFSPDGKKLYVFDARGANTARLVELSCSDGSILTVLASDDEYDISGASLVLNPDTREPEALGYVRERMVWRALNPALTNDLKTMQALDYGDMMLNNRSIDDRYWVLSFTKDIGPVAYWVFDRNSQQGVFLFDHQPLLKNYTLAPMKPIQYVTRDGLTVHGYLTCPLGRACINAPLVLLVHGGPWARDKWGYDSEAQFLASRGYAVLQINYRGSTGYGKAFLNAGNKQWGHAMHNDLIDGIKWAISQNIADEKRIAIFGGSYGGYAALAGATFTPDVFKCAVDIVGPSSIITLIKSIPPYWESLKSIFDLRVGSVETEEEFLKECSPLHHVDKIKIPLLIAQGANDPRVKQAEAEQIVEALKAKGLPYEYMLFPDEGHGFVKPENNIKFYKKAEEFLAKHL